MTDYRMPVERLTTDAIVSEMARFRNDPTVTWVRYNALQGELYRRDLSPLGGGRG